MAKKKKSNQPVSLSPEAYLNKGNARKLPIHECLIAEEWEELKKFPVFVARKHANGNITVANLLIDLLCTGVKDVFYLVNIPESEYRSLISEFYESEINLVQCEYALAHNIVFEALTYAKDFGIDPHKDFKYAEMILEEDDETIPLMDISLGDDGKPLLILHPGDPRNVYYQRQLEKHAGPDNYSVISEDLIQSEAELDSRIEKLLEDLAPDKWEREDWADFFLYEDLRELTVDNDIVYYVFEKCIYEPELAGKQLEASGRAVRKMVKITYEPVERQKYSRAEIKQQEEIYRMLSNTSSFKRNSRKIINHLLGCIDLWPENRVFYNYLYNAYSASNQSRFAEKTAKIIMEKFPDYLFGKISYAQILIEKNRIDEVPEVFNGEYTLQGLMPRRKEFHISEFVGFNTIMCIYFFKKDDLISAYLYYSMLLEIDIPDSVPMNMHFFNHLDKAILKKMKSLIKDVRKGIIPLEDMLALLTNS